MSTIKFDIQKFGNGDQRWTAGVTESAVKEAYADFSKQIDEAENAIKDWQGVADALAAGWRGQDCIDFVQKFLQHAKNVIDQIEEYRTAVGTEIESIIGQWEEFQKGLIS